MSLPPLPFEERDQLAGEYALGVLSGDELAEARARLGDDSEFRSAVTRWWARLAPLLDAVEPREPPGRVWDSLERRLGPGDRAGANVIELRKRVNVWRAMTAGATALAASLALVLLTRPEPVPPGPAPAAPAAAAPMVAVLGDPASGTRMVATWDSDDRSLVLAAAAELSAGQNRVHQLWVIRADGTPRSLGLMPGATTARMEIGAQLAAQLQSGATLAVSVEPTGGSPTGLPTGPVIASGKLNPV